MYLLLADAIVLLPESPVLLFSSQYQLSYTFTDCLAPCNKRKVWLRHYKHDYHVQYMYNEPKYAYGYYRMVNNIPELSEVV